MRVISFSLILCLLGCSTPDNIHHLDIDEVYILAPIVPIYCTQTNVFEFNKHLESDCQFIIDADTFQIREKFKFDSVGVLQKYNSYHSEGPVSYTLRELNADPIYCEILNCNNIQCHADKENIYFNEDTFNIVNPFNESKFVMAHSGSEERRRTLLIKLK